MIITNAGRQVLYFLSGLTCTDENVTTKSGIQRKAAEEGIAIIAPDTSPRGLKMWASHLHLPHEDIEGHALCCDSRKGPVLKRHCTIRAMQSLTYEDVVMLNLSLPRGGLRCAVRGNPSPGILERAQAST